jgi:hypothetical protein
MAIINKKIIKELYSSKLTKIPNYFIVKLITKRANFSISVIKN